MFAVLLPISFAVSFREGIITHQLSYYELQATQLCPKIIFNQVLTDTVLMKIVSFKYNIKILNRGFLDIATYKYQQMVFAIFCNRKPVWRNMKIKAQIRNLLAGISFQKKRKFDHNKPEVLFYLEMFCERVKLNSS